jgi:PleD family two-component response regulator
VAKDPIVTPFGTASATVSMGVTVTSSVRDHSVSELLHEADVSLYAAKKNGRNRVELYLAAAQKTGAGQS